MRLAPAAMLVALLVHRAQQEHAGEERIGSVPLTRAASAFAELVEASARDGGRLWGRPIAGPVLLVDPATRKFAGNQADAEGRLVERSGVFVGTLPSDRPVANAPVEWAGVRWAMVMAPFLGETAEERVALLAHESFHRVQPELGLYVFGEENEHLDALEGRVWMQLEWNALQAALLAQGEERKSAVRDALDFRAARRARFEGASAREDRVEIREGLANYTGLRLAGHTDAAVAAYVADRRTREDGFLRSFAYNSGPLYGYLLDAAHAGWRAEVAGESDLGALLAAALRLEPSATRAVERAPAHGGALIARWGTLAVGGGAILEDTRTRQRRISLDGAAADHLSGPGWTLALAGGWTIAPGERTGDFVVRAGR